MLYVCLRFDENLRLMNYSYYAKFAIFDESIYFRHIDMNVSKYLKNDHDEMIIQKSVSLNDENENECTELILEFQKHVRE